MTDGTTNVLLVEDNPGDARLIQELLHEAGGDRFVVTTVERLTSAVESSRRVPPDVILLDLALPDSRGIETFTRMHAEVPTVPIIVLTGDSDESLGALTVREGAQDYLVKGESDGRLLARSIRYAIERKRAEAEVLAANEHLEQRVLDRTAALAAANDELNRSHRVLQDFIDAMSTLSAKVAPDGRFLIVNKMAQRASGLSLDALMQANLFDGHWFGEDVRGRVRESFRQATEGALVSSEEKVFAFGRIITIHLTFVPVKGADGTVEYVVAEGRDISRRVEVEDALKAANQELEAFTYSVSHDLRAPIRQIDGFSRLLSEQFEAALAPKAQHYLTRIRESTRHMGRLVDDLLRLAQFGREELRPRLASLESLVTEVVSTVQADAENRDICWKIEPLPSVECDPGLLKVALTNLVSNAVKYSRPRNPAVVEIGQTSKNGRAVFFVRDNGVGFDMRYADRLFGVFQRLHRADEFEGTGVGLATVQRILHKHGGDIWAESKPGHGATFFFTIGSTAGAR